MLEQSVERRNFDIQPCPRFHPAEEAPRRLGQCRFRDGLHLQILVIL